MNLNDFGLMAIPVIVINCYLICSIVKTTKVDNKWLPAVAGISGGILGVMAMALLPEYPANDFLTAFAIGIVSGFSATGINQLTKQLGVDASKEETNKEGEDKGNG